MINPNWREEFKTVCVGDLRTSEVTIHLVETFIEKIRKDAVREALEEAAKEVERTRGSYPPNSDGQYLSKNQIVHIIRKYKEAV